MKKNYFFSLFVLLAIQFNVQANKPQFYIQPNVQFVPKTGQTAIVLGASSGYSIFNNFYVGGQFNHVVNRFMPLTEEDSRMRLTSSWGGLSFDYMILNYDTYKFFVTSSLGGGLIDIVADQEGVVPDERAFYSYGQLGVLCDIPVHRVLHLTLGYNYRIVSNIDYKNVNARDIGGISGQIGIRWILD